MSRNSNAPQRCGQSGLNRKTLAKFQAERGNETSDDKGSDDMTSKAERKRKSDASPVELRRRSLAGGNVWDSLADLLKIMKLRGAGADDVKEVREIVQHLDVKDVYS